MTPIESPVTSWLDHVEECAYCGNELSIGENTCTDDCACPECYNEKEAMRDAEFDFLAAQGCV